MVKRNKLPKPIKFFQNFDKLTQSSIQWYECCEAKSIPTLCKVQGLRKSILITPPMIHFQLFSISPSGRRRKRRGTKLTLWEGLAFDSFHVNSSRNPPRVGFFPDRVVNFLKHVCVLHYHSFGDLHSFESSFLSGCSFLYFQSSARSRNDFMRDA